MKISFDDQLADLLTQLFELTFGQRTNLHGRIDACGDADLLRTRLADAVDRSERDHCVFAIRDVDARDTCHVLPRLMPNARKAAHYIDSLGTNTTAQGHSTEHDFYADGRSTQTSEVEGK